MGANRFLSHAVTGKGNGMFFGSGSFEIESAIVIGINDASHGTSFDIT